MHETHHRVVSLRLRFVVAVLALMLVGAAGVSGAKPNPTPNPAPKPTVVQLAVNASAAKASCDPDLSSFCNKSAYADLYRMKVESHVYPQGDTGITTHAVALSEATQSATHALRASTNSVRYTWDFANIVPPDPGISGSERPNVGYLELWLTAKHDGCRCQASSRTLIAGYTGPPDDMQMPAMWTEQTPRIFTVVLAAADGQLLSAGDITVTARLVAYAEQAPDAGEIFSVHGAHATGTLATNSLTASYQ